MYRESERVSKIYLKGESIPTFVPTSFRFFLKIKIKNHVNPFPIRIQIIQYF